MTSEEIISLFLVLMFYFKFIDSGPITYTSCRTTDACIPLKDCQSYMVFINTLDKPLKPSVIKFLNEKQCGFHEGQPKVCCADSSKKKSATTESNSKSCNVENECIPLKTCKLYMDIVNSMRKPLKPAFVSYLRSQQCGFLDGYPTVCCTTPPETFSITKHDRQDSKRQNKTSTVDFDDDDDGVEVSTKSTTTKRKIKKKGLSHFNLAEFYERATAFELLR